MKRLIVLSLIVTGIVFMAGFSIPTWAQSPPNDLKPTFISPKPGLYVNGWPAFTVSYPKEWVEAHTGGGSVFEVGAIRPDLPPGICSPLLLIFVSSSPLPLEEKWAKIWMPIMVNLYTDIKVLSDKPSRLKDGTPAREVEWEGVLTYDPTLGSLKNGPKLNYFMVMTKKDLAGITICLIYDKKIGEDLKKVAYSLTFLPGREEPVQVPPDVRAFLDMYCTDVMSGDVKTIMAHFSDRFLHSGGSKAFYERYFRNDPASPIQLGVTSCEPTVTVFEARGDKAYVDGFFLTKRKRDANAVKSPMTFQQIIDEHGQWRWFGNQK